MPTDNLIEVKIRADASGMVSGMKEASTATSGLTDTLKEWRNHVRTEARYTTFMASQIAGLGIASKGAAAELTGLVSAFAFGGGIGVGVELAKLAAHAFHDLSEAEATAKEEMKKFTDDLVAGTKKVEEWSKATLMALRGASQAQMKAEQDIKPLIDERAKNAERIALLESNVASAREDEATSEFDLLQKLAPEEERELERLRERNRLLTETINKRQVAEGSVATEQIGQDTAKDAEDEAKRNAKLEQLRKDHLRRQAQAEGDAAKALQKMHDEQLAQRVQIDENFRKIEDAKKDEAQRKEEKRLAELQRNAENFARHIGSAVGGALKSVITGGVSLADAAVGLVKGLVDALIDSFVKMAEQWIVNAIIGKAADSVKAVAEVTHNAAIAGSAVAAATAPIALFGAIGIGEAMATAVEASFLPMASAATGMPRVPHDMPVFVHQDETILTKQEADERRAGGAGGGDIHLHFSGAVLDPNSMRHFVESQPFANAMRDAARRGRLR